MDYRLSKINRALKDYDRQLYAVRAKSGAALVMRSADRIEATMLGHVDIDNLRPNPQFIFALTDNWKANGNPVECGIERMMFMLRSFDTWSSAETFESMVERREREARDKERQESNERRAMAMDMRREFAKATNDINTSSLT